MNRALTHLGGAILALAACLWALPAGAGLYWQQGVRSASISVCFVGDALAARPDRVQQILDYIHEFELHANLRFTFLGSCPASVPQSGMDWFGGDIRVVIPGTSVNALGMVPGDGCPMFGGADNYNGDNDTWGSWSNAPDDLVPNRPCLYNLKLGDDPWNATPYLNHTLHEFGHALGLSHEHARADATCPGPGSVSTGYLTPYDTASVMHYEFLSCGVAGNYANTGLSYYDVLSLRILYPESGRPAQIVGRTVIQTGETALLRFGWKVMGAHMPFVVQGMEWQVDGVPASTAEDFQPSFATPGDRIISLRVTDFLGRVHTGNRTVRVVTPEEMDGLIGSLAAIEGMLLNVQQPQIFNDGFE